MNEQNLKKFTKGGLGSEEARRRGREGAKRSAEVKRQRKAMREMLDYLLAKEMTNDKGEKITTLEAIMVATVKRALNGDLRAIQFIRDTIGEAPSQIIENNINSTSFIQKVFITAQEHKEANEHINKVIGLSKKITVNEST